MRNADKAPAALKLNDYIAVVNLGDGVWVGLNVSEDAYHGTIFLPCGSTRKFGDITPPSEGDVSFYDMAEKAADLCL